MRAVTRIIIEVGATRVTLSELAGQTLVTSAVEAVESDPPAGVPREALVAAAVRRALDAARPVGRRAVLVLEGRTTLAKSLRLPALPPDKRGRALEHEAAMTIPFPVNEVVWDAQVFEPLSEEPEALLIAAKRDMIRDLVHAVAANGLRVERVTTTAVALANSVAIHSTSTADGVVCFAPREGGGDLAYVDARRVYVRSLSTTMESEALLNEEIDRSLSFLPEGVSASTLPRISSDDPDLSLAVGAIARNPLNLDLSPADLRRARETAGRRPLRLARALVLIALLGLWIAGLQTLESRTRWRTFRINSAASVLRKRETRMLPVEQRIAELERATATCETAVKRRVLWRDAWREIGRSLPEGMFLLSSEPIRDDAVIVGTRLEIVSYLDKEREGEDAVKRARDALRAREGFSARTSIHSRPTRGAFTRRFEIDVLFAEADS